MKNINQNPKRRTNLTREKLANTSFLSFACVTILIYLLIALVFAVFYFYGEALFDLQLLKPKQDFSGCFYFSLISQLTGGYGDIHPLSVARFSAVAQGIIGSAFWGLIISYGLLKLLTPPSNTIIFSPKAFYISSIDEFGILLINTSSAILTNVQIISTIKFFRRNSEPKAYILPYLRNSALMFRLGECELLVNDPRDYDPNEDGLKVSVKCSLSLSNYSASNKYLFKDIIIVDTTNFMDNPTFQNPEISDISFWKAFESPISTYTTLHDFLQEKRDLSSSEN